MLRLGCRVRGRFEGSDRASPHHPVSPLSLRLSFPLQLQPNLNRPPDAAPGDARHNDRPRPRCALAFHSTFGTPLSPLSAQVTDLVSPHTTGGC